MTPSASEPDIPQPITRWIGRLRRGQTIVWRIGPLCIKRWRPRISPAAVKKLCRLSRETFVCNRLIYIPWLHWTISRWRVGRFATTAECNAIARQRFPIGDLKRTNVIVTAKGPVVIDFCEAAGCRR